MNGNSQIEILPPNLIEEISGTEELRTEFKETYSDSSDIKHTIIAFANAIGGRIFVGVKEVKGKSGLYFGKVIGVSNPSIVKASSDVRQWATSFLPKIDVEFKSYLEKVTNLRVDVIEVKESSQKPVCTSAGLYKIRMSDGNTGIDPARLRQIIVGYDSFKTALILECKGNLTILDSVQSSASAKPPKATLAELTYSSIDAILANGTLASFFNISALLEIRILCTQINKLLDFAISAGGVIIPAQVFYDKINENCPKLKKRIINLLSQLGS